MPAFLLIYLLFLVQAVIGAWSPDLLLLTVVALALTGAEGRSPGSGRLLACGYGASAGFLLDLLSPGAFGLNLLIYAAVGYGTAIMTDITYHAAWGALPLVLVAFFLKLLGGALAGTGVGPPAPFFVSAAITLLLALPWQWAVRQLRGQGRSGLARDRHRL